MSTTVRRECLQVRGTPGNTAGCWAGNNFTHASNTNFLAVFIEASRGTSHFFVEVQNGTPFLIIFYSSIFYS